MPERLVITNGTWLIVFTDLGNAFGGTEAPAGSKICLYETPDHLLDNAREVFDLLDYHKLIALNRPILVAELPAHFAPDEFQFGISALHIFYADTPAGREAMPTINVIPEVILRHRSTGWIRVTSDRRERLPHNSKYLGQYLEDVKNAQDALITQLAAILGRPVPLLPLSEHYARGFHLELPGLRRISTEQFLAVTGNEANFLNEVADFDGCRYHFLDLAAADGAAASNAPPGVSTSPRTHFGSGTALHCSHRAVQALKSVRIGADNRQRFAPRDGAEDGPFCKLWGFETFLCCRRCVFQPVCDQAVGASMPCRRDKGL